MRFLLNTQTHKIQVPVASVIDGAARIIPTADFIDRLPDAAIDKLVAANGAAAKAFVFKLQTARSIDLDSARLITALDRMVTAGILTAKQRADAVA